MWLTALRPVCETILIRDRSWLIPDQSRHVFFSWVRESMWPVNHMHVHTASSHHLNGGQAYREGGRRDGEVFWRVYFQNLCSILLVWFFLPLNSYLR